MFVLIYLRARAVSVIVLFLSLARNEREKEVCTVKKLRDHAGK